MKRINVTIRDENEPFLESFKKLRDLNLDDSINKIIEEHPENKRVRK